MAPLTFRRRRLGRLLQRNCLNGTGCVNMTAMSDSPLRTARTTHKRLPDRGSHDWDTIASILDEALYCHVGFVIDGQPYVVPTGHGRQAKTLFIHGSSASRALRTLSKGVPICVTVTLLDGLVLARSASKHSINYRSVMVLGVAHPLTGDEKLLGLEVITEHMARGRWREVRKPSAGELKATAVLKLDIEEASAKVRSGGPIDYDEDLGLPVWAGHIPFAIAPGVPVPDGLLPQGIDLPSYLAGYRRP